MKDFNTFKKICREFFPKCKFHEWGYFNNRNNFICCYKSGKFVEGNGLPDNTICCFSIMELKANRFYAYKYARGSRCHSYNFKTTPYNLRRILTTVKKVGV